MILSIHNLLGIFRVLSVPPLPRRLPLLRRLRCLRLLCLLALPPIAAHTLAAQSPAAPPHLPRLPDIPALIAKSDITYDTPAATSEEGLPIGNGVMGTLVWTTPSALRFQLNRVDIFANDDTSNNFYQRNTDYCGGAGFLDIDFPGSDETFPTPTTPGAAAPTVNRKLKTVNRGGEATAAAFHQKLSCHEALVTTNGNRVHTEAFVWSDSDIMAVKVLDTRNTPNTRATRATPNTLPVVVRLRTLRPPAHHTGDHKATSTLNATDAGQMTLTQTFTEGDYLCKSALAVTVAGAGAKIWKSNDTEMTLTITPPPGDRPFYIFVSTAATFDKNTDITAAALQKLAAAKATGYDAMLASHKQWWKTFWQKSFVNLASPDGVANNITANYNYFMYVMGSSSRGEFQPKFNGMLWSTAGDSRKWGNLFWGANQSCYYNGMFPANRPELIQPLFKFYTRMYPTLERAAVQQWGSKGIFIPETVGFNGLAPLPDPIAAEMRDLYLARKPWPQRSPEFMQYAATQMPFNSRWNWKLDLGWENGIWKFGDKSGSAFGHVTHIFSRGAKIAYQYWMQYEYTQDTAWLATHAYPIIKGVAEFYRNFPNLQKESDGKYHIRHVNDNESVLDGHNTVEEISSMMGILPAAIKAATILNTDPNLREAWAEVLANLSPLPLNTDHPDSADRPVTFARSLLPVHQGPAARPPDPNTMPVWFFDLLTLESPDKKMLQIANNTYDTYFRNGLNENTRVNVLSKLPVAGTQLGRKDAARHLIPNQINTAEIETLRNRMDLREGYQTQGVQRLGRMADALHNALCQSVPPKPGEETIIRVFPAWPDEWDAQFTLLCRGNFLVTSSFRNGTTEYIQVKSQSGQTLRLRNPWGSAETIIYRNGQQYLKTNENLITFPTRAGDTFIIKK